MTRRLDPEYGFIMGKSAFVYCYPWDLYDVGADLAVDQIARLGVTGVALALNSPGVSALAPMNPGRSVYYGEAGAVYFKPDSSCYASTALQPRVGREVDDPEYMTYLVDLVRAQKLECGIWLSFGLNSDICGKHPKSARIDAFGNPHPSQLSPADREYRLFCLAVTEDAIEQAKPSWVLFEGLDSQPWLRGLVDPIVPIRLGPMEEFLLSLDFSPGILSMCGRLGLDGDQLQRDVGARLQEYFHGESGEEPGAGMPDEAEIESLFDGRMKTYLLAREAAASLLLEDLARLTREAKVGAAYAGSLNQVTSGLDSFRTRKVMRKFVADLPSEPGQIQDSVDQARHAVGSESELIARVDPHSFASKDAFQIAMKALGEAGVDGFAFYGYGHFLPRHLDWIQDAAGIWKE